MCLGFYRHSTVRGKELRANQPRNRAQVVHTQPAAHAAATVVAKQRVQHFPGLIQRWQSGEVIRRQHRLIGDVQPAHDDIQPAVEHFSRRFRVDGDVKFRIRRKVAALAEPPMITRRRILKRHSGYWVSRSAMLVNGPIATSVIGSGACISASRIA